MQTQTASSHKPSDAQANFLRRALQGNALFSLIFGLAFSLASGPIANFLGPNIPPIIVLIVGLGLLPFGYLVYRVAATDLRQARTITGMDIAWVVGSFLLLALGWSLFTVAGR